MESVLEFAWNQCSNCRGISARFGVEWVLELPWNTQHPAERPASDIQLQDQRVHRSRFLAWPLNNPDCVMDGARPPIRTGKQVGLSNPGIPVPFSRAVVRAPGLEPGRIGFSNRQVCHFPSGPRGGADPRSRTGMPAGLSRRGMPFPFRSASCGSRPRTRTEKHQCLRLVGMPFS